jgi:hypothetical protein
LKPVWSLFGEEYPALRKTLRSNNPPTSKRAFFIKYSLSNILSTNIIPHMHKTYLTAPWTPLQLVPAVIKHAWVRALSLKQNFLRESYFSTFKDENNLITVSLLISSLFPSANATTWYHLSPLLKLAVYTLFCWLHTLCGIPKISTLKVR